MISNYWVICGLLVVVIIAAAAFFLQSDTERNALAARTGELNERLAKVTEDQAQTIKEITKNHEAALRQKEEDLIAVRKTLDDCRRALTAHDKNPLSQQVNELNRKLADLTEEHTEAIKQITNNNEAAMQLKDAEIANFRRKLDAYTQLLAEHENNPVTQQSGELAKKMGELIKIHALGIKEITKSHETAMRNKDQEVINYRKKLESYTQTLNTMQGDLAASKDTVERLQAELARLKA